MLLKVGKQEATTPSPPIALPTVSVEPKPTEPVAAAGAKEPEISNEIEDEPFLPILRPFPQKKSTPFFKVNRPPLPRVLLATSSLPVVRQLPFVRRRHHHRPVFGSRPLARFNGLPINNKDDILFLPTTRVAKSLSVPRWACFSAKEIVFCTHNVIIPTYINLFSYSIILGL